MQAQLAVAFLMNYCEATGSLVLEFAATGVSFLFFLAQCSAASAFFSQAVMHQPTHFLGTSKFITAHGLGIDPLLMADASSNDGDG
jgi:hypothetical protein